METNRGKSNGISRVLLLLALLALTIIVARGFTDFKTLGQIFFSGKWQWIAAALFTHVIFLGLYAELYYYGFIVAGVRFSLQEVMPLMFASFFIDAVAPTGGIAGAALFIDDAIRKCQSGARVTVGYILVLFIDLVTIIPFLALSIVYLFQENNLKLYEIIGASFYSAYVLILAIALLYARNQQNLISTGLEKIKKATDAIMRLFKRPPVLKPGWAESNAEQFAQASRAMFSHPRELIIIFTLGMLLHLVNLLGLFFLFPAFDQKFSWGVINAGFSMSIVFFVISVLQGAGVVEGTLAYLFTIAGIPGAKAMAITLAFRAINFWIPLIIGIFFIWHIKRIKSN